MGAAVMEPDTASLQPISLQLKEYKPRDLASSHQVRTRCKIFPPKSLIRKTVIRATDGDRKVDFTDIEFPSYYKSLTDDNEENQFHEDTLETFGIAEPIKQHSPSSEDVSFKEWLDSRKKLRSDLDSLGLHTDWLKRKPIKTALEERVLRRLTNRQDGEKKEIKNRKVRFDTGKRKEELKERRLSDWKRIADVCEKTGLEIEDDLLRDVLLHPGDDPLQQGKTSRARHPPNNLSENFWKVRNRRRRTRRRRRPATADDDESDESEDDSDVATQQSSETLDEDTYIVTFPRNRDVNNDRHAMNLVTGRAIIGRKVDCWMTHEECEEISPELDSTGVLTRTKSDYNAFWAGHDDGVRGRIPYSKLDNVSNKYESAQSKTAIMTEISRFEGKKANNGYDNNMRTWPADQRFVKYGGSRHHRDLNYLKPE